MAIVDSAANKMTCSEIAYIKSDVDNYGSILKSPFYCKLPEDNGFENGGTAMEACKYYDASDVLISSEYCECSLM